MRIHSQVFWDMDLINLSQIRRDNNKYLTDVSFISQTIATQSVEGNLPQLRPDVSIEIGWTEPTVPFKFLNVFPFTSLSTINVSYRLKV